MICEILYAHKHKTLLPRTFGSKNKYVSGFYILYIQ